MYRILVDGGARRGNILTKKKAFIKKIPSSVIRPICHNEKQTFRQKREQIDKDRQRNTGIPGQTEKYQT
jgi:hypothetical protein